MKQKFSVSGMSCSACSSNVEKTVRKLNGINQVTVNLLSNKMEVNYDPALISSQNIIDAVISVGYGAELLGVNTSSQSKTVPSANDELKDMKHRLWVSFAMIIPLMYISMGHMFGLPLPSFLHGTENAVTFAFSQFLLSLPVLYINRKYFQIGFKSLFKGSPNMDTLIAIGSSAATLYGIFAIYRIGFGLGHGNADIVMHYSMDLYFESAVMILTLITLGKFLETKSKGKTGEAL
ncbi:MAG: cation transporter, partial [Oscillospiraceae bacterium]